MFRVVRNFWGMICRMAYWAWVMRNNHDYDFGYLMQMIHLKLKKMEKEMLHKGNAVWQHDPKCRTYKSLKEAIELSKRLSEGEFHFHHHTDAVLEKHNPMSLGWRFKIDPQFRRELRIATKKDKEIYDCQKNRFWYIMNRYGEGWWD